MNKPPSIRNVNHLDFMMETEIPHPKARRARFLRKSATITYGQQQQPTTRRRSCRWIYLTLARGLQTSIRP